MEHKYLDKNGLSLYVDNILQNYLTTNNSLSLKMNENSIRESYSEGMIVESGYFYSFITTNSITGILDFEFKDNGDHIWFIEFVTGSIAPILSGRMHDYAWDGYTIGEVPILEPSTTYRLEKISDHIKLIKIE